MRLYQLKMIREFAFSDRCLPGYADSINESEKIAVIMRKLTENSLRESFYAFYLDSQCKIIGFELLGVGSCNQVMMYSTELYRSALVSGAVSVIVSHNHPSGNASPSEADNALTDAIKKGMVTIGITLLDHVIVTENDSYSYAMKGRI